MYSFSYLEPICCSMSSTNCCFLTCIQVSQEAGQVVWYPHLFQNFPQKGNAKEWSNYRTIALISHAGKLMLKIPQARLQQYVNRELPYLQADFRIVRESRDQIVNICWIIEKATTVEQFCSTKTSISALLTMPKPLIVWITINCGKFFKIWEYQTTWPASWEFCMQVRK